jgi:hypothetical protein
MNLRQHSAALAAALTFALLNTAFAGDIQPQHGGFVGALGIPATAMDILSTKCRTDAWIPTRPDRVVVKIKDRLPKADPAVAVSVGIDTTPTTPCPTTPIGVVRADAVDGDYPLPLNGPLGWSLPSVALGATWTTKYCIYVRKLPANQVPGGVATAAGAEQYELYHNCVTGATGQPHMAPLPPVYERNQ